MKPVRQLDRRPIIASSIIALVILLVLGATLWLHVVQRSENTDGAPRHSEDKSVMEDSGKFIVPGTFKSKQLRFKANAHEHRWASISMKAEMPPSKAKASFIRVSAVCRDSQGRNILNKGGTENVVQSKDAEFELSGALNTGETAGLISCELSVAAPSEEAAATGVPISAETYIGVSDPLSDSYDAKPSQTLPQVLRDQTSERIYQGTQEIPAGSRKLVTSANLQLTTCTISNGSKDPGSDGSPLCTGSLIDKDGSTVYTTLKRQVIDRSGNICESLPNLTEQHAITEDQHHYVMSLHDEDTPVPTCGNTIRYSVQVNNQGPAGLVVHSERTSLGLAFLSQ